MGLFTWLGFGSGQNHPNDETSRAIAGEQITIDWHQADKERTREKIASQQVLKAEFSKLKHEPARIWNMADRDDEINRLEHSLQWNDSYIVNSQNNIIRHQQRARR